MREAKSLWLTDQTQVADPETLLLPKYRDPLHPEQGRRWIAAFAPVRVNGRPPEVEDTGWFVIVQQSQ
jgi:hypothetical protein